MLGNSHTCLAARMYFSPSKPPCRTSHSGRVRNWTIFRVILWTLPVSRWIVVTPRTWAQVSRTGAITYVCNTTITSTSTSSFNFISGTYLISLFSLFFVLGRPLEKMLKALSFQFRSGWNFKWIHIKWRSQIWCYTSKKVAVISFHEKAQSSVVLGL